MYNVLWLVSWYPSKADAFTGDFIQRHAHAVGAFVKLTVLYIVKDKRIDTGKFELEKITEKNCTVYKVYYGPTSNSSLVEKVLSFITYKRLQRQVYKQIEKEQGKPDLVHVHVAIKAGILARYIKNKYQIPYVVTEHWSGYFKDSVPNVYTGNWLLNRLNKKVLQEASILFPVTDNLGITINNNFVLVKYAVIPNVVDTDLFSYNPFTPERIRFIHPSGMDSNKNPMGILNACALLKKRGYDFEVFMVGKLDDSLLNLSKELGLFKSNVTFEQAISYPEVAKEMKASSALLLFSNVESLPCVILEALCCGLPVISSKVGGIAEVVTTENGILVDRGNIEQLANAMSKLIDEYEMYNRESIAKKASARFNYHVVGKQYLEQYKKVLNTLFIN
jgi:glycosyltransferase involved in cell wall biosynthesis